MLEEYVFPKVENIGGRKGLVLFQHDLTLNIEYVKC